MAAPKKLVFLSYAHADREAAEQLGRALRAESVDVWIDSEAIEAGEDWRRQVADALERSEAMVVLLTPHSVQSESVRRDVEYALTSPRFEGRLIPVVIGTEKAPWLADVAWVLRRLRLVFGVSPAKAGKQVAEALREAAKSDER